MPRRTETVGHAYGVDSDLSFGALLLRCLTFPHHEIEVDVQRAMAAGIDTGTTPASVSRARSQRAKQGTALRLAEDKHRPRPRSAP